MAELSEFPEAIMVDILSRLPPKSLMRFKCVNKSWQRLISSSYLAAKHLSVSRSNKHPSSTTFVLRSYDEYNIAQVYMKVYLSSFDLCQRVDGNDDLPPILEDIHSSLSPGFINWCAPGVRISTHCDGILCLSDRVSHIVLCNPAIKQFKCLPTPSPKSCSADGFGYDLKSKDYKIVRVLNIGCEEFKVGMRKHVVYHPPTAEIYSLQTSSWKEIKNIDNLVTKTTIYRPESHSIYRDGILYWCGCEEFRQFNYNESDYTDTEVGDPSELKSCIVSFDIGNEAFQVILAPDDCYLFGCGFGIWNESLAFCTHTVPPTEDSPAAFDIWVMDDLGGGKGRWTKHLTFQPAVPGNYLQLGLFCYNEQLVAVFRSASEVIFHEVFTNKIKRPPANCIGFIDFCHVVECMWSIVSIK